jgi:hypothetical protein
MFKPLRYDSGKITTIKDGTVSEATITKYDALDWASGYLQRATSGSTEVRLIALEDIVTAAASHEDIQVMYVDGIEFECDCTHNSAATQRGTYVDLTDHDTLDNDATSTDVFYITEVVGAAADKKVRGYFVHNIA